MNRLPELLAPMGQMAHLDAAIDERADAIYVGASALNARGARAQFTEAEFLSILDKAHQNGLKVYLALNILIDDSEFSDALHLAGIGHAHGLDAVIVQDAGLAIALKKALPDLTLHASTQFSASSPMALPQVRALGFERVVAPRELLLPELTAYVTAAQEANLEVEAFVHGALCISVSGQCQMSWAEGARSANRGVCAQPCRLNYRLMEDGVLTTAPEKRLSPADIAYIYHIPELIASGVSSLKIEGRLRNEGYVRNTLHAYRTALDLYQEGRLTEADTGRASALLQTGFARGPQFRPGYNEGRGASFLSGPRSGHFGLHIGRVQKVNPNQGSLIITGPEPMLEIVKDSVWSLRNQDQVEIASAPIRHFTVGEYRGQWSITLRGFHPRVLRSLNHQDVDAYMVSYPLPKDSSSVEKTGNEPVDARLDLTLKVVERTATLTAHVFPLGQDVMTKKVMVQAETPADYRSILGADRVVKQLGKFGGTPFIPGDIALEGDLFAPVSWLNQLRRDLVSQLMAETFGASEATNISQDESTPRFIESHHLCESIWPEPSAEAPPVTPRYLIDTTLIHRDGSRLQAALKGYGADKTDLMMPFDRLVQEGFPDKLGDYTILAEWPQLLPLAQEERLLAHLEDYRDSLQGIVSSTDIALPLKTAFGGSFPEGFRLVAGPGSHITNTGTAIAYIKNGYTDLYIDDGVTRGEHDPWIHLLRQRFPHIRIWVPGGGQSRAMTMRFCPVGYSDPACQRCLSHDYALVNEQGTTFPIVPFKNRGCCANLLSAKEASSAEHRSEALSFESGFSQWIHPKGDV